MFKGFRKVSLGISSMVFLLGLGGTGIAAAPTVPSAKTSVLSDQVRLELIRIPYLGVFDNLSFALKDSDTVALYGQVMLPIVKTGAEAALLRLPGILKVENNIEVLPLSSNDDGIRLRTYYAVYSNTGFDRYIHKAIPPIRIIVKNGHVTLEGTVGNELDKNMAVFSAACRHCG
ncbi:MAG: BON domain-containing protein [Acidobacteriota bacterium]